jgi:hypothetical protein
MWASYLFIGDLIMAIRQRDTNRAELVKAIIRQNGGRIFTVIAKRKEPKVSYVLPELLHGIGPLEPSIKQSQFNKLIEDDKLMYTRVVDNFMEMTCRTGVKKDLKGGESTIAHKDDLISINLTNGKGYRCFSAYNVLELRAGGTVIKFKEEDVLSFEE